MERFKKRIDLLQLAQNENVCHFRCCSDVVWYLPQLVERYSLQKALQHLLRIYPSNVLHAFYLWLPLLPHLPQMVHQLPSENKVAPYLLNLMIDMFLKPFSLPEENNLFPGQLYIQWVLIVIAFVSVPMMLLPKPLLLRRDHKRKMHSYHAIPQHAGEEGEGEEEEEEEFDFGEVFIHQIIHTIEFVLGAISNTASYLRLWALSLAHSELATVFWERVLVLGFEKSVDYSLITAFVSFAVWAGATFGVLLIMESLSAFLHALRLHWVEFQNKFYTGDGYRFVPFSYRRLLSGEDD